MRLGVGTQAFSRTIIGDGATDALAQLARRASGNRIPRVNRALRPGPAAPARPAGASSKPAPLGKIVYFPACPTRLFGSPTPAAGDGTPDLLPTPDAIVALLERVGYEVIVPEHLEGQCCGQPWQSKGFPEEADRVGQRLDVELSVLSESDRLPV